MRRVGAPRRIPQALALAPMTTRNIARMLCLSDEYVKKECELLASEGRIRRCVKQGVRMWRLAA